MLHGCLQYLDFTEVRTAIGTNASIRPGLSGEPVNGGIAVSNVGPTDHLEFALRFEFTPLILSGDNKTLLSKYMSVTPGVIIALVVGGTHQDDR